MAMEGWLTPSIIVALDECPQSTRLSAGPGSRHPQHPSNAGDIAHTAVQQWLQHGEWQRANGAELLGGRFDRVRSFAGLSPQFLPNVAQTRKRLELRAPALVRLIESAGAPVRVESEVLLRDDHEQIFGYADLAVRGIFDLVIDLKTDEGIESDKEEAMPQRYRRQLLLYAHLMECHYGRLPSKAVLFTLRRGPIALEVSPAEVRTELLRAVAARELLGMPARPGPSTCRFCRRRLVCAPQWEAVGTWEHSDALRGVIQGLEVARNGYVTIALRQDGVLHVIRKISATSTPGGMAVGDEVAIFRIRSTPDGSPHDWVAQRAATVQRLPA